MSALVSDWISYSKDFWRRTAFLIFLLIWSIFVLFFTGKSSIFWPTWNTVSNLPYLFNPDLPYLFERVVKLC